MQTHVLLCHCLDNSYVTAHLITEHVTVMDDPGFWNKLKYV